MHAFFFYAQSPDFHKLDVFFKWKRRDSGSKYLQYSSRMQKISIKFVDVIGSEFYL